MIEKKINNYRRKFYNVFEFSENSVSKIFNINAVKNKESYYYYSGFLWQEVTRGMDGLGLSYN